MAKTIGLVFKGVENVEKHVETPKKPVKSTKTSKKVEEILPDGE